MKINTVFIIDQELPLRRNIKKLLKNEGIHSEYFSSAKDFITSRKYKNPGCVISEVQMPGMSGAELQEMLNEAGYCPPFIFLSSCTDISIVTRVMKNGAVDFFTKPVDTEKLLKMVKMSLRIDKKQRAHVLTKIEIQKKINFLSPREYEVMTYVISGMLNKQIANHLKISEKTVKIHRGRMMHKLGIKTVVDLVGICQIAGVEQAVVQNRIGIFSGGYQKQQ